MLGAAISQTEWTLTLIPNGLIRRGHFLGEHKNFCTYLMETLIGHFLDVTNATPSIAREYLALARDDLELALCMWFDQGTAQTEKAAFQPVVSPQTGDRSASLLAEIRTELATLEGEILEVGKIVTGLEKVRTTQSLLTALQNPTEDYILVCSSNLLTHL